MPTLFLAGRMTFRFRPIRHGFKVGTSTPGFYGESEYTTVDFTLGDLISRKSLNCTGNGTVITVGLQTEVNGAIPISCKRLKFNTRPLGYAE